MQVDLSPSLDDILFDVTVAPAISLAVSSPSRTARREKIQRGIGEVSVNLLHGDCLDVLRTMEDCSVDSVVTDPPYGLAACSSALITETMIRWASGDRTFIPEGAGFMGKGWDAFVPPPAVWDEVFRVLKPGGHVLAFAGSRTQDLMGLAIRLAGFEIRDSVAWLYGSGFPKSMDVSKQLQKIGSQDAKDWAGWGTALKPAYEPVLHATKPFNMVPLDQDLVKYTDEKIKELLWASTSCARHAAEISASRPAGQHEAMLDSVPENAGTGMSRELSGRTGTCNSQAMVSTFLNIGTLWNSISESLWDQTTTCTISMKSRMTTELRILNSLLGQAISWTSTLVRECSLDGALSTAENAVESSSAGNLKSSDTRTATAHENAMSLIAGEALDVLASIVALHSRGLAEGSIVLKSALTGQAMTAGDSHHDAANAAGASTSQIGTADDTALSSARAASNFEPVIMARKPLSEATVAQNVLLHGTGGINIDGSRIGTEGGGTNCNKRDDKGACLGHDNAGRSTSGATFHAVESELVTGRFPANILLDEFTASLLDAQSGISKSMPSQQGGDHLGGVAVKTGFKKLVPKLHNDQGGASRFFYVSKANKSERPVVDGIAHPTVKPLDVMRWLIKLVTPPGGVVLEPFAGSGTTVEAAILEGFDIVAIEREASYIPLIEARVARQLNALQN